MMTGRQSSETGKALTDPGGVGGRRVDIGVVLPVYRAVNPVFRIKYVDGDPLHWEGPG